MTDGAGPDRSKLIASLRQNGPKFALEAVVNFLLPILIYDYLKPSLGDVQALLASSAPPIVWSLIEFARHRRIDALSVLVLGGIVLSLLAFLGGGSVKWLQLREKLVTVLIGVAFLGSAAIGRPLIYELARAGMRRRSSSELESFEALNDNRYFRRSMTTMTVVWGVGLVAEAALSGLMVLRLSVHDYLVAGPIAGYATTGGLALWTFWYSRRQQRRGRERRAAEAAMAQSPAS